MVLFLLIVQSSNIVELFKDFTVMTFILSLDDVVFQLAEMGVLGNHMKEATEVTQVEVHSQILRQSEKKINAVLSAYRAPPMVH